MSKSKKSTVKKTTKKAAVKASVKKIEPKLSLQEQSFNRLIEAWLDTTMGHLDLDPKEGGLDSDEVLNRLNTLFRVSCRELGISAHSARDILDFFADSYEDLVGVDEDYVCPDCLAKQAKLDSEETGKKIDKLLN